MSSRGYNLVLFGFWLVTMGWLLSEHVLPPLMRGDPPDFQRMVAQVDGEPKPPVRWRMLLNDQPVGRAKGITHRDGSGVVRIEHQARIEELPVREIAPRWMAPLMKLKVLDA